MRVADYTALDYESLLPQHSLELTVDMTDGTDSGSGTFRVQVTDGNELPTVQLANVVNSLAEDVDTSESIRIAEINVTDDALGTNVLTLSGTDAANFEIVETAGVYELHLLAGANLDFETQDSFAVSVQVDDPQIGGTPDDTVSHTVSVIDVNEPATITLLGSVPTISEDADTSFGYSVIFFQVDDEDNPPGSNQLSLSGADAALFEIVGNELRLVAGAALDRETNPTLDVTLEVDDAGIPGAPDAFVAVSVSVTDVNDTAPSVDAGQTVLVSESATVGSLHELIAVVDPDATSGGYSWRIEGTIEDDLGNLYPGAFELVTASDGKSGAVRVLTPSVFDFDNPAYPRTFLLRDVVVSDGLQDSAAVDVMVTITDANDNAPEIATGQLVEISESALDDSQHGTVAATDADTVGTYNWSITSDIIGDDSNVYNGLFDIVPTANGRLAEIKVLTAGLLDYDNPPQSYTFEVTLNDGVHDTAQSVQVNLLDENDTAPEILPAQAFHIDENSPNGAPVLPGPVVADDADTVGVLQSWQLADPTGPFVIDDAGVLRVADSAGLDYETLDVNGDLPIVLSVRVYDGAQWSAWTPITLTVNDAVEDSEISVKTADGTNIADGTTTAIDFGEVVIGNPVDLTFTVTNHGDDPLDVAPVSVPAGFAVSANFAAAQQIPPGESRVLTVTLTAVTDGTFSGDVVLGNSDPDEDPFNFAISGAVVATSPEILVSYAPLADEFQSGGVHSFGAVQQGDPGAGTSAPVQFQTFFVSNVGTRELVLNQINSIPMSTGFSIASAFNVDVNGELILPVGETASFTVAFDPDLLGTVTSPTLVTADVTFPNDDLDENPFTIRVVGTVLPAADVLYFDDSSSAYSSTGVIEDPKSTVGFGDSYRRLSDDGYGEWSAMLSTTGLYRISATWPDPVVQKNAGDPLPGNQKVSNAAFSVFHNANPNAPTPLANAVVNQLVSPNDRHDQGLYWDDLGVFYLEAGELSVRLNSAAKLGTVIADAIRVERVDLSPDFATLPSGRIEHRIDVLANDPALRLNAHDPNYLAALDWTVQIVDPPTNGQWDVEADNTLAYRPNSPYNPSADVLTYKLVSALYGFETRVTTVELSFVSGETILVNDRFETSHSRALAFDVTANDFDPQGRVIAPVFTSAKDGWIDWVSADVGTVYSTVLYVEPLPDGSGEWSLTFNWGDGNEVADFAGTSVAHITSVLEALPSVPAGAVEVLELEDGQHYRIRLLGALGQMPMELLTGTNVTIVNARGDLVREDETTWTYTPNPAFFRLHNEYTEAFRYTAGTPLQPALATVRVFNHAPQGSAPELINMSYEVQPTVLSGRFEEAIRYYQLPIASYDADGDPLYIVTFDRERSHVLNDGLLGFADPDAPLVNNTVLYQTTIIPQNGLDEPSPSHEANTVSHYLTYRLFDGFSYSDVLTTRIRATAMFPPLTTDPDGEDARFRESMFSDTGIHFDQPRAELVYYGSVSAGSPEVGYRFQATTVNAGFQDRQFEAFGDVAIDPASGTVSTGQALDLDLMPGTNGDVGLAYSSRIAQPRPVIQGTVQRDAGSSPIMNLTADLTWYYFDTSSNSTVELKEVRVADPGAPGQTIPLSNIGIVSYSGSGTTSEAEVYHFAVQSPAFPDTGFFNDGTGDVEMPLHGVFRWKLELTATLEDGDERPWTLFGDTFIAPRDSVLSDGTLAPAESGPFRGFGKGWTLSGMPYLQVFRNTESGNLADGYQEWADDRVLLVTDDGDARMFAPFGKSSLNEQDGLEGWRPVAFDDRFAVPDEFGSLSRDPVTQEYTYTTPNGIIYYFDDEGLPIFVEPLVGPGMGFVFNGDGHLERIAYGTASAEPVTGKILFSADPNLGETIFTYTDGWLDNIALPTTGGGSRVWDVMVTDGHLTDLSITNAASEDYRVQYAYDTSHHLTSVIRGPNSPAHVATSVEYDAGTSLPIRVTLGDPNAGGDVSVYELTTLEQQALEIPATGFVNGDTLQATIAEPAGLQSLSQDNIPQDVTGVVQHDMTYDARGRLLSRRTYFDELGTETELAQTTFERNAYGDVVYITDSLGRVTTNTYDYDNTRFVYAPSPSYPGVFATAVIPAVMGNVTSVFADYVQRSLKYNAAGYLVETRDALGRATRSVRDAAQRITAAEGPHDSTESWTYGNYLDPGSGLLVAADVLLEHVDARGLKTTYSYDPQRRVAATSETSAAGTTPADLTVIMEYFYDDNGNADRVDTRDGNLLLVSVLETTYDDLGRLVASQLRDGSGQPLAESSQAYYQNGLLKDAVDGRGTITRYEYDTRGYLTTSTFGFGTPVAQVTTTEYYPDGAIKQITPVHQQPTRYFYDPKTFTTWVMQYGIGTLTGQTTQQVTETITDEVGRVTKETDRLTGAVTRSTYDRQDRRTSRTAEAVVLSGDIADPNRATDLTTTYTYDAVGNLRREKRPDVAAVVYDYNGFDQVVRAELLAAGGGITHSAVNAAGDIVRVTEHRLTPDGQGGFTTADHVTEMLYDEFGRIIQITDPGPETNVADRQTTYSYEQLGLKRTVSDRNDVQTVFLLDAAGRLWKQINPDGSELTSKYDLTGMLIEQVLEFDPQNQTANSFRRSTVEYDALGRISRSTQSATRTGTHDDDLVIEVTYTDSGAGHGATAVTTTNQLRRADLEAAVPGTVPATTTYADASGKTVRIEQPDPDPGTGSGGPVTRFEYTFDAVQRTARIYTYDPVGRRSHVVTNAMGATLRSFGPSSPDPGTGAYASPELASYIYDAALRPILVREAAHNAQSEFEYDPVTGKASAVYKDTQFNGIQGTTPTRYAYDSMGNLVQVTDPAGNVTTSMYDGLNRKTEEQTVVDTQVSPGIDSGDAMVTRTWSYVGLTTTYTDRNQRETTTVHDPLTNTVTETWIDAAVGPNVLRTLVNRYNPAGDLLFAEDYDGDTIISTALSSQVIFTYDQFGRSIEETQSANVFGTDAPVVRLETEYDALGLRNLFRVNIDQTPADGPTGEKVLTTTTYENDPLGRLDWLSRVSQTSEEQLWSGATIPKSLSVNFSYQADSQRNSMTRYGQPDATSGLDPEGHTSYQYDTNGRVSQISHNRVNGGAVIAVHDSTYSPSGRLETKGVFLNSSANPATNLVDELLRYTYGGRGQIEKVEVFEPTSGNWIEQTDYEYQANGNRQNGVLGRQNRLLQADEDETWQYQYDAEGHLIRTYYPLPLVRDLTNELVWDHRGRLIEVRVHDDSDFDGTITRRVQFEYDALDRRIARQEFDYDTNGDIENQITTYYAYDGSARLLEIDLLNGGTVQRNYVLGPQNQILATDESFSGTFTYTVWTFADASGSIATIGLPDGMGDWQIQHRRFHDFGEIDVPGGYLGDRNGTYLLDEVPVVWNGAIRDEFYGALHTVYDIDDRWFDDEVGRFLAEDPRGIAGGQTNLYVLHGNDPLATINYGNVDWSTIEGPSPELGLIGGGIFLANQTINDATGFNPLVDTPAWAQDGAAIGVGILGGFLLAPFAGAAEVAGSTLAAGAGAGVANGLLETYAGAQSGHFAPGASDYLIGALLGGVAGIANPYGQIGSLGAGAVGAAIGYVSHGGTGAAIGYQAGSLLGGITGGSLHDGLRSRSLSHASKFALVEGGFAAGAGGVAAAAGGDANAILMAANFGSMAGGIAASKWVKCFVIDTPVVTGLAFAPLYAAAPAIRQNDSEGTVSWVVGGLTALAATSLVLGDRKRTARALRQSRRLSTAPPAKPLGPTPEAWRVDFDDVCHELLTTPPGRADSPSRSLETCYANRCPREEGAQTVPSTIRKTLAGLLLILSGVCFWNALPDGAGSLPADGVLASAHASSSGSDSPASDLCLETRPIQDIRVGQRVLAHNPEVSDLERAGWAVEPDWSAWVFLKLQMPKPGEGVLHIDLIRPRKWLEAQAGGINRKLPAGGDPSAPYAELIGRTIELDLPELGATGPAAIHAIGPCPEIETGDGQVVTATFHHESSTPVLDVAFADEDWWQQQQRTAGQSESPAALSISPLPSRKTSLEHVGVTGNHLFWAVDRQAFVPIGEMDLGERVQTYHGETKRIAAKLPRPGPQDVYNLEVYGEHVYHVTSAGLLVHNAYGSAPTSVTSQVNPRLTQRLEAFRAYRANGGTMDMARWAKATQGNPAYGTGFKSGFADWSRRVGQPVHGNSLAATGPHDVYVLRNANTGELLHFGETGRGYLTRFAEHQRDYARLGIDIDIELLRTVEGKAAARAFESRYIDTYIRVFGQRPPFNPVNH